MDGFGCCGPQTFSDDDIDVVEMGLGLKVQCPVVTQQTFVGR